MHSVALEVKKYILKNELILSGSTVICGFSGGADSMCMLEILHQLSQELDFKTVAVHLNHGIRGKDADSDEQVCKEFCRKKNIEIFSKKVDIKKIAKERGCGEEEAGREERYAFFNEIAKNYKNALIATAHTKNDLAETVLHRVIRGSSVKGLAGIQPKRENIIRPILCLSRKQVEKFCADEKLGFVTDETNFKPVYTRNKIRLEILPRLETINKSVVEALSVLAETAAADRDFIDKNVNNEYRKLVSSDGEQVSISINDLMALDTAIRTRIIIKMAENCGISLEYKHVASIDEMCKKEITGKECDIPGGRATVSYGSLIICGNKTEGDEDFCITACSGETVKTNGYEICVDIYENPENTSIVVRSRRDGDKIVCNSMTKKLKKVFIDLKIPQNQRNKIPVVEINGEIFCVGNILKSDALKKAKEKIKVTVKKTGN